MEEYLLKTAGTDKKNIFEKIMGEQFWIIFIFFSARVNTYFVPVKRCSIIGSSSRKVIVKL